MLISGFAPLAGVSASGLAQWLLCIVFVFWAFYTLVAVYHWFKYSHASRVALPAIILHVAISLTLMAYAFSGALTP